MSVIWQLPGDILHSVYSEWLGWKDVSRLDVACVGKSDREVWLTSLTDLRIFNAVDIKRVSDGNLRLLYIWLKSRRVFCVEDFPVSVNVLEDLMVGGLDMESYCPALRSIHIRRRYGYERNPDVDEVKDNLSDFLSHCHSLEGVTIVMIDEDRYFNIVLEVLIEKLRENSLIKIGLWNSFVGHESKVMSETLLTKHASSLQHLYLDITDGMEMHIIASTLINNHIHLRLLDVSIFFNPSPLIASLISYLSSAGDLLESLKVKWYGSGTYNTDALLVSVATSCSKLTRMLFYGVVTCSMEKVRLLYEQCLHLQDAVIDEAIDTNSTSRSVSIWVKGSNDDWAVCLSHALRRRQCKKVTLRLRGNYYHPVENLKSMLEPYQICVNTCFVPEAPLISLLQDLPHLYRLDTMPFDENCNCDAILAAILEHVESLRELDVTYYVYNNVNKVDKLLNELITRCQLLDVLKLLNCGMPSIVAVSKHSSLRNVSLHMTELVSEEILDGLLLDEKVHWPSTLKEGIILPDGCRFYYKFNKKSHHWIKH